MDQELNSEGICCTCSFRAGCLSYKNSQISGRAIMHCEVFDDLAVNMVGKKQKEMHMKRGTDDKGDDLVNSSSAKGLCLNCDDAKICKFAGFGDDIVFCEEHSSNFDNGRQDRLSHKNFCDVPILGVKNLIPGWDA